MWPMCFLCTSPCAGADFPDEPELFDLSESECLEAESHAAKRIAEHERPNPGWQPRAKLDPGFDGQLPIRDDENLDLLAARFGLDRSLLARRHELSPDTPRDVVVGPARGGRR